MIRFLLTQKWMKGCEYSSYPAGKSRWWPLLQVRGKIHLCCVHGLTCVLVFAIQKCDPAPFYLFDEVGLDIVRPVPQSLTSPIDRCEFGCTVPDCCSL